MVDSQLLSPTLALLQRRLLSTPFVDGTVVSFPSARVVNAAGEKVTWPVLMETLLMEFFAHAKHKQVPVHPAVETFEVRLNGSPALGARVRCEL